MQPWLVCLLLPLMNARLVFPAFVNFSSGYLLAPAGGASEISLPLMPPGQLWVNPFR